MNPSTLPDVSEREERELEGLAMNIVHQIGDALYEALPKDLAHEHFVKARQATNDHAIDFAMQLITTHTAKRVAAYHNDITDNERKVWLYSEDLQRRLLDARLDELGAVGYFSDVGLVHYNDDGSTVRKLELRIEDLEDERQKLEEKL